MIDAGSDAGTDEQHWARLMVSSQGGDEDAYRQLLTELGEAINRYLHSRFGRQHFLEDCVQDTLIAVHQARHTYDPKRAFRPWLFAIVRHKAIDSLRRHSSQQQSLQRQQLEAQVGGEASSQSQLEDSVTSGRLIDSLSPQHRDAINLTKIAGFTTAEAAAQLSISESALKVRVHRGIARLRKMLEVEPL